MSALPDSVRWYATLLIITLAFAPLVRLLCGRLPDRGASIAKPLGLLATVWPVWFLASISPVPYAHRAALGRGRAGGGGRMGHRADPAAGDARLAAGAGGRGTRHAGRLRRLSRACAATRPTSPAPKSRWTRPSSPPRPARPRCRRPTPGWPAKRSTTTTWATCSTARWRGWPTCPTWVAFNLALATTFAMTVTAAAGLGYAVARTRLGARARRSAAAALAAFLIAIAGNLHAPLELAARPAGDLGRLLVAGHRLGVEPGRRSIRAARTRRRSTSSPRSASSSAISTPTCLALPFTIVALGPRVQPLLRAA